MMLQREYQIFSIWMDGVSKYSTYLNNQTIEMANMLLSKKSVVGITVSTRNLHKNEVLKSINHFYDILSNGENILMPFVSDFRPKTDADKSRQIHTEMFEMY